MRTPNDNQFEKSFGFDVRRVVERLKRGVVGIHIEQIVMTNEVQDYFTVQLVKFVEQLAAEMTPEARDEFKKMTTPDILWQNFSVNLAMNAFVNGLKRWFNADDDKFDDIIIDFVTVENAKRIIDALRGSFKDIAGEIQARNIMIDWPDCFGGNNGTKFYS